MTTLDPFPCLSNFPFSTPRHAPVDILTNHEAADGSPTMMELDSYSDDDLDNLDVDTLQELENRAIQSTQKLAQSQAPRYHFPGGTAEQPHEISDDDDDNGEVIDQAAQPLNHLQRAGLSNPAPQPFRAVPSIAGQQRLNHQHQQQQQQQQRAIQPRYGQPPSIRPNPQYGSSQNPRGLMGPPARQPLPPSQSVRQQPKPRPAQITKPYVGQQPPTTQGLRSGANAADKEKEEQIRALEAELQNLRTQLITAQGEAKLIRSKYDHVNDQVIPQLKKENAEQTARMERKLQEAQKAQQAVSHELLFANADLQQERGRAKTKKVGKDGATTPGGRNKTRYMRTLDGFSDVEVMGVGSPSRDRMGRPDRLRDQGNGGGTPTKGKRKRPAFDSPSFALEMETDGAIFEEPGSFASSTTILGPSLPYDFLKLVLDHSPLPSLPLTFESFARFCFPSKPSASFASIIFRRLPQLGVSNLINSSHHDPFRLLVDFSELLLDMWQQCLSERYHSPIYYLAALLQFILQLNAVKVAPRITSSLVPVVATTCRLVALPRLSLKMVNKGGGKVQDLEQHANPAMRKLAADINVTHCLRLLYLCAVGCLKPPSADQHTLSPQAQFWKTMDLEFVVLMLNAKQPEQDWRGMLSLLRTSIMPTSVGPLPKAEDNHDGSTTLAVRSRPQLQSRNSGSGSGASRDGRAGLMLPPPRPVRRTDNVANRSLDSEPDSQASIANVIINRVSSYLVDTPPRWASPGSAREISIKLAALQTLMSFASSSFGFLQLANSDVAIPRTAAALCWAIDSLYDVDIPSDTFGKLSLDVDATNKKDNTVKGHATNRTKHGHDNGLSTPQLLSRLISETTKLLHALITDPKTSAIVNPIARKLATPVSPVAPAPPPTGQQLQLRPGRSNPKSSSSSSFPIRPIALHTHTLHGGRPPHSAAAAGAGAGAAAGPRPHAAIVGNMTAALPHRYLVSLARISFAEEDLVFEQGIDEETVERAHELLELAVERGEGGRVKGAFV
ncbi:hypothetical protein B0T20DRAFT_372438, partial [Sordaria brevicollis]